MSEAAVDRALAALPLSEEPLILETGCGAGEILRRAVARHRSARGLGIDLDADAIAEARQHAGDLPLRFEVGDAATVDGEYDAVINVASSHVHGGFPQALRAFRDLAPVVLYGEGFWEQPPSEAFLVALGGATVDELPDLAGLRGAIRAAGFDIVQETLASHADWARYEETLATNAEAHGTADALAYAEEIRRRRALPGGGDTLGFALFVLRNG
jgi:SAM-dependent methyltransferase